MIACVALTAWGGVNAQSKIPQYVNFQAVARDDSNNPIIKQPIEVKLTILQGGSTGTPVYGAVYQDSTNQFGEFSRVLGTDPTFPVLNVSYDFKAIPWEKGNMWAKIEYKSVIGGQYKPVGTFQYLAQPYSFASGSAEKLTTAGVSGQVLTYDGTNWVAKDATAAAQKLAISGTTGQVLTFDGTNWVAKDAPVAFDGKWASITGKPTLFDGTWASLAGKPTLFDGTWGSLTGKPTLHTVATSGDFNDLKNKPTAITKTSQLTNDSKFGVFMPGMIMPWAGDATTVPAGWLLCDGIEVTSTQYPDLYNVIATFYGKGAGNAGSFNIPDFRGVFLRGANNGATWSNGDTFDPEASLRLTWKGGNGGDNVGSYQRDAFQGHWHDFQIDSRVASGFSGSGGRYADGASNMSVNNHVKDPISDGTNGTPRTSTETRPVNIYVNYIIKY